MRKWEDFAAIGIQRALTICHATNVDSYS